MPHIVLEGHTQLEKFFTDYTPSVHAVPNGALKLLEIFINQDKNCILIEAVAAEGGPPNRFFVQVLQRGQKTTVKLYPGSDPEKTPGVKRLLAMTARQIKECSEGARYGATNLTEYLL